MEPDLCCATDLLSLVRNTVVAKLARLGLAVELVFSSDFRWIYALISANDMTLEELAMNIGYPLAVDLATIDPEASEPCNDSFTLLADVFADCSEVSELLHALRAQGHAAAAAAASPSSIAKPQSTSRDAVQSESLREAYAWYLRSRLKGRTAMLALSEANNAWPKEGSDTCLLESGKHLRNFWDLLLRQAPAPEVVRVVCGAEGFASVSLKAFEAHCADGSSTTSHFERQDRLLLIMAAIEDACDVFKLMSDGFVIDVVPCEGSCREAPQLLGQGLALQLSWQRHFAWAALMQMRSGRASLL